MSSCVGRSSLQIPEKHSEKWENKGEGQKKDPEEHTRMWYFYVSFRLRGGLTALLIWPWSQPKFWASSCLSPLEQTQLKMGKKLGLWTTWRDLEIGAEEPLSLVLEKSTRACFLIHLILLIR